jgi:hypothetical protein
MKYNLYFEADSGTFNVLCLEENELNVIINAYKRGSDSFTINGVKHYINGLSVLKIFTYDLTMPRENFLRYCHKNSQLTINQFEKYLKPSVLKIYGEDITSERIGNIEFGEYKTDRPQNYISFINADRLIQIKELKNSSFDFSTLIKLCDEINDNFARENYFSVAMLCRSLIDHIPPIFNQKSFREVANNYGSKSFKDCMQHLENSMRKIADLYLHSIISKKVVQPNRTQVNFSQEIDLLLSELVKICS